MSKFAEANEKIAEKVVEGYKKIEAGVVVGYKKIEDGVVDGVLLALAYPVYNAILRRRRKKLAPEILSLTEELLK